MAIFREINLNNITYSFNLSDDDKNEIKNSLVAYQFSQYKEPVFLQSVRFRR